ncbi:NACHT, LRR and PYD domains-containing protein 3-like [Pleurodeles waltl]
MMEEKNSRMGEYVNFRKRYTQLLIMKRHCDQEERKHEIMLSGEKHLELLNQRAACAFTNLEALFHPDEDGHIPRTVVIQGVAGIGKTMTVRMIMLDWASRKLFQDKFEFLFYIPCRTLRHLPLQLSIEDLLSHCNPGITLSISSMLANPEKVLFVVDGFDELKLASGPAVSGSCCGMMPMDGILIRLISKTVLPKSFLIITTRPTALETLGALVKFPRFAEILGFSKEDRKEYFLKFFANEMEGTEAFNAVAEHDILFTMCYIPIICWIVCTVTKPHIENKESIVYALRTITLVYMSFLSNLLKQQDSHSEQVGINSNLKKLCCLAKEGVWEQKILFEESDLIKHGLDITEVMSLFLKNDIFRKDTECEIYYSFVHLSFQEFFAAVFYVLGEDDEAAKDAGHPPQNVIDLMEAYMKQKQSHLMLTVRFLFGLLNQERLCHMKEKLKWKILPNVKPALQQWVRDTVKERGRKIVDQHLDLLQCLFETQDEEFVRGALEYLEDIELKNLILEGDMTAMDFRALTFCLKNSPGVLRFVMSFYTMKPEDLRELLPGLIKCSSLELEHCSLTSTCCAQLASFLKANTFLKELNLSFNGFGDNGVRELCEGLKHNLQTLEMMDCDLTDSCCVDIATVLRTNTSLKMLNLSFNGLKDSGVRLLCDGLKHLSCKTQRLMLGHCSLTGSCCAGLSSVLQSTVSLTDLELDHNLLKDSGIRELCVGLQHSGCRIRTLVIDHCSLTGSCCKDIAAVLKTKKTLKELNLSHNRLKDSGVLHLCEGLKHPACKIQRLFLRRTEVTDDSVQVLCSVLSKNASLQVLDLFWNDVTQRSAPSLNKLQSARAGLDLRVLFKDSGHQEEERVMERKACTLL